MRRDLNILKKSVDYTIEELKIIRNVNTVRGFKAKFIGLKQSVTVLEHLQNSCDQILNLTEKTYVEDAERRYTTFEPTLEKFDVSRE